jgi:hypothetical protein
MGEGVLMQWAPQAGMTANKAGRDKGGWDFLVQYDGGAAEGNRQLQIPLPVCCLMQVKATDGARSVAIKLDNWARFCSPGHAAFFLVMDFQHQDTPVAAYLVHVSEAWVARTLERIWKLPEAKRDQLHRVTMMLKWDKTEALPELNGRALRATIEKYVGQDTAA